MARSSEADKRLWYAQPAERWVEALPIGNGRLGGMVFGGTVDEHIQLNEDSLWTGHPIERANPKARESLDKARQLLFDGRYEDAERLIEEGVMGLRIEGGEHTYQSLGDLRLTLAHPADISDYTRELDLETAIVHTAYTVDGVRHTREVFASAIDQAIVVRLTSDHPAQVSLQTTLQRSESAEISVLPPDRIVLQGHARDGDGVGFQAQMRIIHEHGSWELADDGCIRLDGADSATLIIVAATDYLGGDPHEVCERRIALASGRPYDLLRRRHIADHQSLFSRVTFELDSKGNNALPTDSRLEAVRNGAEDLGLLSLYFHYARYLLIACSRPGTMCANLQGIWEEGMTPPWNADYHININIQMIYWIAEVCNLAECHKPFFDLIEALRARGSTVAQNTYGCRGFVAHHTTDAWFFADVIGKPGYGMWTMGIAWCCQHLWEHYAFGGDREFLADRAYPLMKEAALFMLDFLVEHPRTGKLVSGPSTSPENKFRTPDGQTASVSMGCTMDHQIIADLFTNCIQASEVLNTDADFRAELQDALQRLASPRIGSDGRLLEWCEEFDEPEPGHRHVSHLFGLHPGRGISVTRTPDFAEACRKTLAHRLAHGGGHTGWSRAWITNFYARLRDGSKVHENLQALLAKSTHPNLFDDHPPFQIDGNFGGCAAMAEALLQSHAEEIHLLPALPPQWPSGRITGLRGRGGVTVDIDWEGGALVRASLEASQQGTFTIRYGNTVRELRLDVGEACTLDSALEIQ